MLAAALQSNTSLRTLTIHAHSLDAVAGEQTRDEQTGEGREAAVGLATASAGEAAAGLEGRAPTLPRLVDSVCSLSSLSSLTLSSSDTAFSFMSEFVTLLQTNMHLTRIELQGATVLWCAMSAVPS